MAPDHGLLRNLDTARTLFLQAAPVDAVVRACAGHETEAGQRALAMMVVAEPAQRLCRSYRRRVLRALLRSLDGHEIDEGLVVEYLAADSAGRPEPPPPSGVTFEISGSRLFLETSDAFGGVVETSGRLWPAAPALAAWLHAHAAQLTAARVLELGAGPGLCGLALACCAEAERVTLTDLVPDALRRLSSSAAALAPRLSGRVSVEALDWRDNEWRACEAALPSPPPAGAGGERRVDLVIASDVAYDPLLLRDLCDTIGAVLRVSAAAAPAPAHPPRAWLVVERRSEETFAALAEALAAAGLEVCDRSERLRLVCEAQLTFYCVEESLPRMMLLELTAPPKRTRVT